MEALAQVLNSEWRKHWKACGEKQPRVDMVWATCVFSWSTWSYQTKIKISSVFHCHRVLHTKVVVLENFYMSQS